MSKSTTHSSWGRRKGVDSGVGNRIFTLKSKSGRTPLEPWNIAIAVPSEVKKVWIAGPFGPRYCHIWSLMIYLGLYIGNRLNASYSIVQHIPSAPIPVGNVLLNKKPFYALANHIDRIPSLKCKSGVLLWGNLNTIKYAIYQRTKNCILRRVFSLFRS